MKEVAILLLVALLLNGCGTSTTSVQTASGSTWQAQMLGGEGTASGFSFITQFTVGSGGTLSISSFQFLTQMTGGCFPVTGGTEAGTLNATFNSAGQVTGTFSFTVVSGGNTLTLTGTSVTGTLNTANNILSNGVIMGTWTLVGGTGCNATGQNAFTMTQTG
jgi:hypothetical protein